MDTKMILKLYDTKSTKCQPVAKEKQDNNSFFVLFLFLFY